mmetsp:Transcript_13881/g.21649  ORF Transcript_13881/g.21649 Transcript_13881/m.21649 type:complete len:81 (-) Transcript_13881:177-419(-)
MFGDFRRLRAHRMALKWQWVPDSENDGGDLMSEYNHTVSYHIPYTNHVHPPDLNTGIPALCHSLECSAGPGYPPTGLDTS